MAEALPHYESFLIHADGNVSIRWEKWARRLDNLFVAANITSNKRKRALLLHYGGSDLYDIYETLPDTGGVEDYTALVTAISTYFKPKKNIEYEVFEFRRSRQKDSETIDDFHVRLRQMSKNCEFDDANKEIKSQIIQHCLSKRLRRKGLKTPEMTLDQLLTEGRMNESSERHASGIEKESTEVNHVRQTSSRVKNRHRSQQKFSKAAKCWNCNGSYPHSGMCPAQNRKCKACDKYGHYATCCRGGKPRERANHEQPSFRRQEKRDVRQIDDDPESGNDSDSTDSSEFSYAVMGENKCPKVSVKINNHDTVVLIDTGSSVNLVNDTVAKKFPVKLQKCHTKVYAYNSMMPLPVIGQFRTQVVHNSQSLKCDFLVVKGNCASILGYSSAHELGIVQIVSSISQEKEDIVSKYPNLCSGLGKLKGYQMKLHIDESVSPMKQTHRRIPFHQRAAVEKCVKDLLDKDIIEPVNGPTPWINPIVLVPKPKQPGELRMCVDMRAANKAIQCEKFPMPTLDELVYDLNGAKYFSKLDLNLAYHQIELEETSRYITTFTTHLGLFRYKRLSFGINAAAEKFQSIVSDTISGIKGSKNISDDIIIFGENKEEHDLALNKVLERLSENGYTLNLKKCEIGVEEIGYYGMIFSAKGLRADPSKLSVIKNMKPPTSGDAVRSFLGMTNYVSRFIPGYSELSAPLRDLTRKSVPFTWTKVHQSAFDKLKNLLCSSKVITYFDPNKDTELYVDASPHGLGAILSQGGKVVSYGSRALSPVEKRYKAQIEREALAITWACEHYQLYLLGKHFSVFSDHKPLVPIFNNPNSKASVRIEAWRLRLQRYDFTVKYIKGKFMPSDYPSRYVFDDNTNQQCHATRSSEDQVIYVINSSIPSALTLEDVVKATKEDKLLQMVIKCISNNQWWKNPGSDLNSESFKLFCKVKDELTCVEDLVLRGNRIVIPLSLQNRVIHLAHEGHQGIVKTKSLLRDKLWFPYMDKLCTDIVKDCVNCQVATDVKAREPLSMTVLPDAPWEQLSVDFKELDGKYLLVIIDDYSRYPIVEIVHSTAARVVLPKLDKAFSQFGVPKILKSDNGPPFNGHEFTKFSKLFGFKHRKVTPLWPEANGEAERFMRTLKKFLHASSCWKKDLNAFLMNYRATPHCTTNVSPFSAMFGRSMKTKLPQSDYHERFDSETFRENDLLNKEKIKKKADERRKVSKPDFQIGDTVLVKNTKKGNMIPPFNPNPFTITDKRHSLIKASNDSGKIITRNSSFFKKLRGTLTPDNESDPSDIDPGIPDNIPASSDSDPESNSAPDPMLSRSKRIRKLPSRYKDFVMK